MVRGLRCTAACAVLALLILSSEFYLNPAHAVDGQGVANSARTGGTNAGVVGIISGELNSTSLAMTGDLSTVLDEPGRVRIVPMVGRGPVQTIRDILYLRGTDIGIVRSDILNHFKKKSGTASLDRRLHFIAKLHNEEVHVLSRMNNLCLSDLNGKQVNFGIKGSGSNVTASLIFDAHKVKVLPVYLDQSTALEKLKNGEIDATIIVSGKPSPIFSTIKYTDRVHFLDVEFAGPLKVGYLPSVMSFTDYPDLVARNETVSTISVSAVMAAYNWKTQTNRHENISRFIETFFKNFDKFKQKGRHAKWQEVDIADDVPGWTRYSTAQKWLEKNRPEAIVATSAPKNVKASFQQFLSQQNARGPGKKKLTPKEQESLFNQFVGWMKNQSPN